MGLHYDDMEELTYGMVQDLFIESDNDTLEYQEKATQADFDWKDTFNGVRVVVGKTVTALLLPVADDRCDVTVVLVTIPEIITEKTNWLLDKTPAVDPCKNDAVTDLWINRNAVCGKLGIAHKVVTKTRDSRNTIFDPTVVIHDVVKATTDSIDKVPINFIQFAEIQ